MQRVEVRNRRIKGGSGALKNAFVNAPAGIYQVLGVFGLDRLGELTEISKGREYARILCPSPGLLFLLEPEEIVIAEGERHERRWA